MRRHVDLSELQKLRVLMITEGTYPFTVGGVSTWCQVLLDGTPEISWTVLPVVGGRLRRSPQFAIPANTTIAPPVELWSDERPRGRGTGSVRCDIAAILAAEMLSWNSPQLRLAEVLTWCRRHPVEAEQAFRHRDAWAAYLDAIAAPCAEGDGDAGTPPMLDAGTALLLYQTLRWVARTAAHPTPAADVSHVTAAGWAALPAVVDRLVDGTPLLLTEHGVYVREAYLGSIRDGRRPAHRFVMTRLARSLARLAYRHADLVCPVTAAHRPWEVALGADPGRIRVIHNGVLVPNATTAPPGDGTVVCIGRIDPLKDVATLLRTARLTLAAHPRAQFVHYGPVAEGHAAYGEMCRRLHADLGLGSRFRFMGGTDRVSEAIRAADVVILTSISEALPMAVLEAMAQGRPVVATAVGGVPEALAGGGVLAPPGDARALSDAVVILLRRPDLARRLGVRGRARAARRFGLEEFVAGYRSVLAELVTARSAA